MKSLLPVLLAIGFALSACNKDEIGREETIRADSVSNVSTNSARIYSTLIFKEGVQHDLRVSNGIVYSLSPNPDTSDFVKPAQGLAKGIFWSDLNELTDDTTYFVRTYFSSLQRTVYGNQFSFKTRKFEDGSGNFYSRVVIGKQTWLRENLKTTKYLNGDTIGKTNNKDVWQKSSTGLLYDRVRNEGYGQLYNSIAVKDQRTLCPAGTHIPSNIEWQTLGNFLGDSVVAAQKLKTTSGWATTSANGTNSSNFSALPAGCFITGSYSNIIEYYSTTNEFTYFWSTGSGPAFPNGLKRVALSTQFKVGTISDNSDSKSGYSVRCIKD